MALAELDLAVAVQLAAQFKTLAGFPWDGVEATAADLVRWCRGSILDNTVWPPEAQARWLVDEARDTWDKWKSTASLRALFMSKFERRKLHPEQNVFNTAELQAKYGPPDPEWSQRLVKFPAPTGNKVKDHRDAINAMRYQAIRDCLYYTEGLGRFEHEGDAKERRNNEAWWQKAMDYHNERHLEEVKFLRAAIAAGKLDATPPLPEYSPTANVRSLTQAEFDRLKPALPESTELRCSECGGTGRLAGDDYCSCRTGRDLRRIES
jgi:hypothetical protein